MLAPHKPPVKTSVPVERRPAARPNPVLMVLRARLLKGARIVGATYHAGARCADGFARRCACTTPSLFCRAKTRWLALAGDEEKAGGVRKLPEVDSPYYVVEAMKWDELEATELTISIEAEEIGLFKVGPQGHFPWAAFRRLIDDPALVKLVKTVLRIFEGSTVLEEEPQQKIMW